MSARLVTETHVINPPRGGSDPGGGCEEGDTHRSRFLCQDESLLAPVSSTLHDQEETAHWHRTRPGSHPIGPAHLHFGNALFLLDERAVNQGQARHCCRSYFPCSADAMEKTRVWHMLYLIKKYDIKVYIR